MKRRLRRKRKSNQSKLMLSALCLLLIMTVGYAAFQTSLNITAKGNIKEKSRVIQSWTSNSQTDFHSDYYKENIVSATFLDNNSVPSNATDSWDVSETKDKGVMAYVIPNNEDNAKYDLYIGAKGKVIANTDSSMLFGFFENIKSIDFKDNFDTSKVTNMHDMFAYCTNLQELDLSSFDTTNVINMQAMFRGYLEKPMNITKIIFGQNFKTNNVTDMRAMFGNCGNLTEVDVSGFDTSNVTDMHDMFSGCQSITYVNISNFNTSKVTDMAGMFFNCNNIDNLDFANFNTSQVTTMTNMFAHCFKLSSLNLCSFDTTKVTNFAHIFHGTAILNKVTVGSNWITTQADTTDMFAYSSVSEVTKGQC